MIHPTAIVDSKAELDSSVSVGPYSVIGAGVRIGKDTSVGPHVVVNGPTTIGERNKIFQFSSIGEECQDKKYAGEPTTLTLGDDNTIREGVTMHRGTVQDISTTTVGSGNLFMAYVHVAHDCVVGNNNVFANNATIAGHVKVGNNAILGGFTAVHQFCHIGSYSMASMCSAINMDVPAFVMVRGNMAQPFGMNYEGMRRRGYSKALIQTLRKCYKLVYREGLTLEQAMNTIEAQEHESPEVALFLSSLKASSRGIVR